jgi:hypothetical protein
MVSSWMSLHHDYGQNGCYWKAHLVNVEPGSRDDAAGFRTLKESFLRLVKGGRKKQV